MAQKDVFLASEGDAWYARNRDAVAKRRLPEEDAVLQEMLQLPLPPQPSVLEIGCNEGTRLAWLREHRGVTAAGVDPSAQAVQAARARGVNAWQGTADKLPIADRSVDLVIFGFCLYLCDREDLFSIAAEADRVLASPGWIVIEDFYSPVPVARPYSHRQGVRSYKMDYRTLFTWHPAYECYAHRIRHHSRLEYTDDRREWVAISVLRRMSSADVT